MTLGVYGHGGMPVLVFPSSEGSWHEYDDYQMVETLAPAIDAGRLRLYAVSSDDSESWYGRHRPPHERARRHGLYEDWVMSIAVPRILEDLDDADARLTVTGCSFGAYHAANFALKFPERFEHALCMSGVYDVRFLVDGHHDDWVYFNNPMQWVPLLHGPALDAARRTFITLVCGQGPWETVSLDSTKAFRHVLDVKGIPNYMDLWGHDVAHDWHWWRVQIRYFMHHLIEGTLPWRTT
ncbi:MAG: esterase family protein [Phycisphaerales bacterium]|nr:esterase family protein [Phycisphaerales bacterium]